MSSILMSQLIEVELTVNTRNDVELQPSAETLISRLT